MMKLCNDTVNTLKNFSQINPSLVVDAGSEIVTMSPSKTIIARMVTEEVFDQPFCIYELNKFLGLISMLEDPDLQFKEKSVEINSKTGNVNYTYADRSMVVAPLTNKIAVDNPVCSFQLNNQQLTSLIRAAGVLQTDIIRIVGSGGKLKVGTADSKDPTSHTFDLDIDIEIENDFMINVKTENVVKILPSEYNVTVSERVIQFLNDTHTYWIVSERSNG
jgi:hypothetical protein